MRKYSEVMHELRGYCSNTVHAAAHHVKSSRQVQIGLIASFGILILLIQIISLHQAYKLNPKTQALLGPSNTTLDKKLTFDSKKDLYQYNKQAASGKPNSPQAALATAQSTQKAGGGASNYAVDLASNHTRSITVRDTTDTTDSLAITLTPNFATRDGKLKEGRVVYPLEGKDGKLVYSLKANGLKEDLVLTEAPGDSAQFSYELTLPKTLEAKLLPSGAVGIYSADPALFGNISFGSDADRTKVEAARQNSPKTHLVFGIPAPTIAQTGKGTSPAKAHFKLDGDKLTVVAEHLKAATYPLSIDPSVLVTSATDFGKGNFEGGAELDGANGQIKRSGLTGGNVSGWQFTLNSAATSTYQGGFTTASLGPAVTIYNGYVYHANATVTEYAQINSDGTLGTWTATGGTPPTSTSHLKAYNGYLYLIGADQTNSTVYYAPIKSDHTIGGWNSTAAYSPARSAFAAEIYNGYVYVMGGCSGGSCNSFSHPGSPRNDTVRAPIKADGSLGSFVTETNTFTRTRFSLSSAVYNGYLYVTGGCDTSSNGCASVSRTLTYAPINSDGSLGTWSAEVTTGPASNSYLLSSGMMAYNGYMYSRSDEDDVMAYAQINADGSLGPFQVLTNSSLQDQYSASYLFYNNYMYQLGGYNGGSTTYNTVQFAKVSSAGVAGTYADGGNNYSATVRYDTASVIYNNCIYVIGGFTNSSTAGENTMLYAPLNANGSVGSWVGNSVTYSTNGRAHPSAVAANGYIYIAGGQNNGTGTYFDEVDYAPLNTSGCGISSAFQTTSAMLDPATGIGRASFGLAAYGGYLYAAGGVNNNNSNIFDDIQKAQINSDGTLGAWSKTGNSVLPTTRAAFGMAASNGYLYIAAGRGGNGDTQYAPINSNATVGSWTSTNALSTTGGQRYYLSLYAYNGYIYASGGSDVLTANAAGHNDTQVAQIQTNGSLGVWSATTSFSSNRIAQATIVYNNYIYQIGGCTNLNNTIGSDCPPSTALATIEYAPLNNGGPGTASSWTTSGNAALPANRSTAPTVAYNGFLYAISGDATNPVEYAAINADGTIGAWNATSTYNGGANRTHGTAVAYNGYMYLMGGAIGQPNPLNDVQFAPINANGTLGAWHYTHAGTDDSTTFVSGFSGTHMDHSSVTYNGYLYVIGGCSGLDTLLKCQSTLSDVQYALICTSSNSGTGGCTGTPGTVGTWGTTTSLPVARLGASSVAVNGYLYEIGGCTSYVTVGGGCNGTRLNEVLYAQINSNGTIGSWNTANSFATGRYLFTAAASNGYMCIMGGITNASNGSTADVQCASINSNGTVGNWSPTNPLTTARWGHGGAAYNGYFYITGGSGLASVERAGQQAIPHKGKYSYMFDHAGDATATKLLMNGTMPGGSSLTFGVRGALDSTASFGSTANSQTLMPGSLFALTPAEARYKQLVFTLDDAGSSVFPDSLGTPSTITDFELYFHAAPAKRLRGGKTFTDQTQRQLDTTPN